MYVLFETNECQKKNIRKNEKIKKTKQQDEEEKEISRTNNVQTLLSYVCVHFRTT